MTSEPRAEAEPPSLDEAPSLDQTSRLRLRAAWMYYVENLTQSAVAERLGLSRVAVVRLLADARRRGEVRISVEAPLADLTRLERALEERFGLEEAILAPISDPAADPTAPIAAAAGAYVSRVMESNMTVGVGWGRTLASTLPHIAGRTLDNVRVVSLLGGIAQARRFNPTEFAWQFAELFQGEGFLVPAPAVVDSPETKRALLERCGLAAIFQMADALDMALVSVGGVSLATTAYRVGHLSETERQSLIDAGAVGDVLFNFIDAEGRLLDHPVNARVIAVDVARLRRARRRLLISGGPEKIAALLGAIRLLEPTVLISDEATARAVLERAGERP